MWPLSQTLRWVIVPVGEQEPLCLVFRGRTPVSRAKLLPLYRRRNVLTCSQHRAWGTHLSHEKAAFLRHWSPMFASTVSQSWVSPGEGRQRHRHTCARAGPHVYTHIYTHTCRTHWSDTHRNWSHTHTHTLRSLQCYSSKLKLKNVTCRANL